MHACFMDVPKRLHRLAMYVDLAILALSGLLAAVSCVLKGSTCLV